MGINAIHSNLPVSSSFATEAKVALAATHIPSASVAGFALSPVGPSGSYAHIRATLVDVP